LAELRITSSKLITHIWLKILLKRLAKLDVAVSEQPALSAVIDLYKERVNTLK